MNQLDEFDMCINQLKSINRGSWNVIYSGNKIVGPKNTAVLERVNSKWNVYFDDKEELNAHSISSLTLATKYTIIVLNTNKENFHVPQHSRYSKDCAQRNYSKLAE